MATPNAQSFLPSIDAARRMGVALPEGAPFAEERMAALFVQAALLVRNGWTEQKWLSLAARASLLREPPPQGRSGAMYHVAGRILEERPGFYRCVLHHYNDEPVTLHDTFVPSAIRNHPEMPHFDAALAALIAGGPPEALRCHDLMPREVGAAYRSVPTTVMPDFHGYAFGDALERAAASVGRVFAKGQVLDGEVRVYAWPFLWLKYGEHAPEPDVALVFDAAGALHCIGGKLPA